MANLRYTSLYNDANIVSYWEMEGNSTDSKGLNSGSDTTITYGAANGKYAQGALFNGSSSGIAVASSTSLRITGSLSIVAWIKPNDSTPNRSTIIFGKGDLSSAANDDYALAVLSRKIYGSVSNGSAEFAVTGGTTMSDNTWHHVAVVFTATSKIEVYLDGVSDGSNTTSPVAPQSTTHAAAIGKDGTSAGRYFKDSIDDIAIFNRVLTTAEILTLYKNVGGIFIP
jgi:hypothetical protein